MAHPFRMSTSMGSGPWSMRFLPRRERAISNGSSPSLIRAVAAQAMSFRRFGDTSTRVLVNGTPGGVAWLPDGSPFAVMAVTVRDGRIARLDILADPDRLRHLDLGPAPR
jgi:hypothetical protein